MCVTDSQNSWFEALNFRTCDCPWLVEYLSLGPEVCMGFQMFTHMCLIISPSDCLTAYSLVVWEIPDNLSL